MNHCLLGERCHVKSSQTHKSSSPTIAIRDLVRAMSIGDVDLDDYQVRRIIKLERFHMFIEDDCLVTRGKISSQCGQPQGRKQRISNGTPIRISRLCQGRKKE